jgi:hypothetical protein
MNLINILCECVSPREWVYVKTELERYNYLLRDQIGNPIK